MKIEKEVTIYVESFIDAMEIVDKMDIPYLQRVMNMDEDSFEDGKCYVIIDKTMFLFFPVYKLLRKQETFEKIVDVFKHTTSTSKFGLEVEKILVPYLTEKKEDNNENISNKVVDSSNVDDLDS